MKQRFILLILVVLAGGCGDGEPGGSPVTTNNGSNNGTGSGNSYLTERSIAWYRVDKITGKNDGDVISSWADANPNGVSSINATLSAMGTGPQYKTNILNGHPVLRFSGANCLNGGNGMNLAGSYTMMFVARNSQIQNNGYNIPVFTQNSNDGLYGVMFGFYEDATHAFVGYSSGEMAGGTQRTAVDQTNQFNQFVLATVMHDGSGTFTYRVNSQTINPTITQNGTGLVANGDNTGVQFLVGCSAGGSLTFIGDIAEVAVLLGSLAPGEVAQAECEMAGHWGLPCS